MKRATITLWPVGQYDQRVVLPNVKGATEQELANSVRQRLQAALQEPTQIKVEQDDCQDVEAKQ